MLWSRRMPFYQSLQYYLWCFRHQQEVGNVKTIGLLFIGSIVFQDVADKNLLAYCLQ